MKYLHEEVFLDVWLILLQNIQDSDQDKTANNNHSGHKSRWSQQTGIPKSQVAVIDSGHL